jgi:HEAT repeat protein
MLLSSDRLVAHSSCAGRKNGRRSFSGHVAGTAARLVEDILMLTTIDLVSGLKHTRADTRAFAAQELGKLRDKAAIPALVQALGDEEANVRVRVLGAIRAIGAKGNDVVFRLIMRLRHDPDTDARCTGAAALGVLGEDAWFAVPSLILALKDQAPSVRFNAAGALGCVGHRASLALAALRAVAVNDLNEGIARAASRAGAVIFALSAAEDAFADAMK